MDRRYIKLVSQQTDCDCKHKRTDGYFRSARVVGRSFPLNARSRTRVSRGECVLRPDTKVRKKVLSFRLICFTWCIIAIDLLAILLIYQLTGSNLPYFYFLILSDFIVRSLIIYNYYCDYDIAMLYTFVQFALFRWF